MKINRKKVQQHALLINGMAFLFLTIITFTEKSYLFAGILLFTSVINILSFRIWKGKEKLANPLVNLFNAIVSAFTAYDFFMKDSKHIWKIYLLIALIYFIITLVMLFKHISNKKTMNEEQDP
jgi:hypothetical protein